MQIQGFPQSKHKNRNAPELRRRYRLRLRSRHPSTDGGYSAKTNIWRKER